MSWQAWLIDRDARSAVLPCEGRTRQFWEIDSIVYHRNSTIYACVRFRAKLTTISGAVVFVYEPKSEKLKHILLVSFFVFDFYSLWNVGTDNVMRCM